MPVPTNRELFKDLCLRRCGADVVNVEITEDQCQDLIDYALSMFWDYHYNGSERIFLHHQITQEDKDRGYIVTSDLIIGVTDILSFRMTTASPYFDAQYQFMANEFFSIASTEMVPYVVAMEHLETIYNLIGTGNNIPFRYNQHTNKLYLDTNWNFIAVGSYILAEVNRILDPKDYVDIWKDRWLTDYTSSLFKRQVGEHVKKHNLTMPGGVTFNGQSIYEEAVNRLKELEEDLKNNYSLPPRDYIG